MSFDELWAQVKGLPGDAVATIPDFIANATKKKLAKRSTAEVRKIVADAINEVNNGSIEKLDILIQKRL